MNENESLLYSAELNYQNDFPAPIAIIRHVNEIQCNRSVKLVDREDFTIFLQLFYFLFVGLLVIELALFRRRPANTRRGKGEIRPNFRHSKSRAGYRRRQFLPRGWRLIFEPVRRVYCELYLLPLRPIPSPSSTPSIPYRVPSRSRHRISSFADLMLPIVERRLAYLPPLFPVPSLLLFAPAFLLYSSLTHPCLDS